MNDAQIDMTLYKINSMNEWGEWRYPSSIWGICGLPAVILCIDNFPDNGETKTQLWRVQERGRGIHSLSDKVCDELKEQLFLTRREALQAVEMAVLLAKSEEDGEE